jgi:hypothetical protein
VAIVQPGGSGRWASPGAGDPSTAVLEGAHRKGLSGPVMSLAETGDSAVRVWDAFQVLLEQTSFLEARRARALPPQFPAISELGLEHPGNSNKEEQSCLELQSC